MCIIHSASWFQDDFVLIMFDGNKIGVVLLDWGIKKGHFQF